jgi:hypothetical protein
MFLVRPYRFMKLLQTKITLALWGKFVQGACRVDPTLKREVDDIPLGTSIIVAIGDRGPTMVVHKDSDSLRYLGDGTSKKFLPMDISAAVYIRVRSFNELRIILTSRESINIAIIRGRVSLEGSVSLACRFLRILQLVEIYLLPKRLAFRAVKRYQAPPHLALRRMVICSSMLFLRKGVKHDAVT